MKKQTKIKRTTGETDISLEMSVENEGVSSIKTGIPFFDHMLSHIAKHGNVKLNLTAKGDIDVDFHHTVEDVGIVLGQAILDIVEDKKGINRYGEASIPMDEALANIALDISGRAILVFNVTFSKNKIGEFDTELVEEFFQAFTRHAGMTLHVNVPYGTNNHHVAEAIFKAFGKALRRALSLSGLDGVPSTKGTL